MGGETRTVGNYLAEKGWRGTSIGLRNGTFVIKDPRHSNQSTVHYDVLSGATLIYDADPTVWTTVAGNGTMDQWVIDDGARGEMYGKLRLGGVSSSSNPQDTSAPGRIVYQVKAGGTFVYGLTGLNTTGNNWGNGGVYFENSGRFIAANGIDWNGVGDNNDSYQRNYFNCIDNMLFVQKAGTMYLGGPFCKTARNRYFKGNMRFELAGGTLNVSNTVSFYTAEAAKDESKDWDDQVFASMPVDSTATVEVSEGAVLDMSPFTYGDLTYLTKTGSGQLVMGSARSTTLTVQAGSVRFIESATVWTGVAIADDAQVVFTAEGNNVDTLDNAANVRYSVDASFPLGGTILTSSDAVLLQTVCSRMTVPSGLDAVPTVVGTAIVLKSRVVLRPYPRTLVAGEEATGNGYRIVSGPEGAEERISGTPVYGFGGYAGAAGRYELTLSGLSSDSFAIEYQPEVLTVIDESEACTFYWRGQTAFADYWNTNNWSLVSADSETVATRLPCSLDKIWSLSFVYNNWWHTGKFDLGGGTYQFDTFDATGGTAWQSYIIAFTNGTLEIKRPPNYEIIGKQQSPRYEIYAGATLRYTPNTTTTHASPSGLQERWLVHAGGRAEFLNYELFCSNQRNEPFCEIDAGGTLLFTPTGFGTTSTNYGKNGARLVNRGTMLAPNGIVWSNASYSNDSTTPDLIDRVRFIQESGQMLLGGPFCKTALNVYLKGEMVFELKGGLLEVTNAVTFYTAEKAKSEAKGWGDQVFAEMSTNAVATIQVDANSSIDLAPFTYCPGTSLTKTGPGTALFGTNTPVRLSVMGGQVSFAAPPAGATPATVSVGGEYAGEFPLRIWKDANGEVVNDTLDVGDGLSGDFTIRPVSHGFKFPYHESIRLCDYASDRELPAAKFAGKTWEFCRVASDPDALYLRHVPSGLIMTVK